MLAPRGRSLGGWRLWLVDAEDRWAGGLHFAIDMLEGFLISSSSPYWNPSQTGVHVAYVCDDKRFEGARNRATVYVAVLAVVAMARCATLR